MFASDRLLFHLDISERLRSSSESKRLWLESVKIAVHDFKVVHKRTPAQRVMTDFFNRTTTEQIIPAEQQNWQDTDTTYIPALI
eukprot:11945201-Ditylum_brightwellii.AAC.1